MSTNGEDGPKTQKHDFFESPNISSTPAEPSDETTEKVKIDGVPIAEEDIEYRADDIKQHDDSDLFVNVEGAAKRAREAARKKEQEERERAQELKEKKKQKDLAEKWAKAKIEDYHNKQNREAQERLKEEKVEARRIAAEERREKRHAFLKKYKYAIIVVILIAITPIAIMVGQKIASDITEYVAEQERLAFIKEADEGAHPTEEVFGETDTEDYEKVIEYTHEIAEYEGNEKALEYLNGKIKNADKKASKTTRARLHEERSFFLYMNYVFEKDNPDEETKKQILKDAYLAEELSPNWDTATNIAMYEDDFGDKTKAEKYAKIAEGRPRDE
ncbi:hypothetical protein J6X15_02600 [Candidatus Saccharibacteria bacterium]|nr:hypothetical protein [Candidatus Saccharibacteria bacterium]